MNSDVVSRGREKKLGRGKKLESTRILIILGLCIILQLFFNAFIALEKTDEHHKKVQESNRITRENFTRPKTNVVPNEKPSAALPKESHHPALATLPYTYARSVEETITSPKRHVKEFERQDDVVIVTKIHGRNNLITLEQSLCLLHYAYNKRTNYNIIVFYTDDMDEKDMVLTRELVYPASVSFVKDSLPLQEVISSLPEKRRENLMKRCLDKNPNITLLEIDWWTDCPGRINYNWQAEFRAWHIWRHVALSKYKYMLWMDSDGFPTRQWTRDPVSYMINNDLVLFAAGYGGGNFGRKENQQRIFKSFNKTICKSYVDMEKGFLVRETGDDCFDAGIQSIKGYFHLTNLDFYRSDMVDRWVRNWIGDCFLCREYDDQAAVTLPALMLAPERSWTMDPHNFSLGVFHNGDVDNKRAGGFKKLWKEGNNNIKIPFPEARGKCEIKAGQ